ncbi:MAG: hypothetical protein M3Q98_08570 [Actinomycetota bacterium]|nr:hypothetical protein [Actinomycetota bacterium]
MSAVIKWFVAVLALGTASGFAWLLLANPAEWEVTTDGVILTEEGAKGRFGVIVTFVLIGIVASFVWGLAAGLRLNDIGWPLVPLFVLGALLASVIAWQIGAAFGPPDPASVTGTSVGDKLPQELTIDSVAPFLVWPIFALSGLLLAVYYSSGDVGPKRSRHRDEVLDS